MKKLSPFILSIFLISLNACTGMSDFVNGELKMSSDHQGGLALRDTDNQWHNIYAGEYQIDLSPGFILDSINTPEATLKKDGKILFSFYLPRALYESTDVKVSASDAGQIYDIHRTSERVLLSWKTVEREESCTTSGYCYGCDTRSDSEGKTYSDCGYGYRNNCSGWEHNTYRYDNVRYDLGLEFIFRGKSHGKFRGKGQNRVEAFLLDSSQCRT